MATPIGSRVIAILEVKDGIVRAFGEGIYAGDFKLPPNVGGFNFGQENPRIDLDDGGVVWGCESWWGPAESTRIRFPADKFKWEAVDLAEHRARTAPKNGAPT